MKWFVCGTALLILGVVALYPIGKAVELSLRVDGEWSLAYYGEAVDQIVHPGSYQRELMGNTLALGGVATLLALLLGLPYALLTSRYRLPGRAVFESLYLLPVLLPPLIASIAWTQMTRWYYDWRGWTMREGFPFSGLLGSAFVFATCYVPFVILFTRRSLARIPASVEEAGILSVGRRRTLTGIVLPLALSGILAGAVFVFLFTVVDFAVVDYLNTLDSAFGKAYGDFAVYPVAAFQLLGLGGMSNTGKATAQGLPIALLALVALLVAFALRRRGRGATIGTTWRPAPLAPLGRAKVPATAFCAFVLAVSFGLPVAILLVASGARADRVGDLFVKGIIAVGYGVPGIVLLLSGRDLLGRAGTWLRIGLPAAIAAAALVLVAARRPDPVAATGLWFLAGAAGALTLSFLFDALLAALRWRLPGGLRLGVRFLFVAAILAAVLALPVWLYLDGDWNVDAYRRVLTEERDEIETTVYYGALAASFGTMLAFVLAWMSVRSRGFRGRLLEVLAYLPLIFPPLLLGFGMLVAWNAFDPIVLGIGFRGTKIVVPLILFALLAKYLPFSFSATAAGLLGIERSQEEAAAASGVPWGRRMWGVVVPLARSGIVAGWILMFVFCLREIDTLAFLRGPESVMFRIYSWIHTQQDDRVAALSVIQVALMGIPFLTYGLVAWRRMKVV